MRSDDVIEQVAKVLSRAWNDMHTNESLGYQRMLAGSLAHAGLLARPLPDREQIAKALFDHSECLVEFPGGQVTCSGCGAVIDGFDTEADHVSHQADVVLALLEGRDG